MQEATNIRKNNGKSRVMKKGKQGVFLYGFCADFLASVSRARQDAAACWSPGVDAKTNLHKKSEKKPPSREDSYRGDRRNDRALAKTRSFPIVFCAHTSPGFRFLCRAGPDESTERVNHFVGGFCMRH